MKTLVEKLVKNQALMIALCALTSIVLLCMPLMFTEPVDSPWLNFLGNFHPLVLHLPIGVLILVFTLEIFGFFAKEYRLNMMLPLIFNAIVSVLAAVLGVFWYFGGSYGTDSELLNSHLWQGLIYATVAVWLPLIYHWFKGGAKVIYYVVLVGSVGIMISAAHLGGDSVHQGGPMKHAPWNNDGKTTTTPVIEKDQDPVVFIDIIVPIFEQKCYACHHSSKKVKSGFKMDTLADIMEGGDYQDDDPALTPGDASKSMIVQSIELPDDDDLHMPPPKKEQVTADELAILKWWVNSGASDKAKLSELKAPASISAILEKDR